MSAGCSSKSKIFALARIRLSLEDRGKTTARKLSNNLRKRTEGEGKEEKGGGRERKGRAGIRTHLVLDDPSQQHLCTGTFVFGSHSYYHVFI